MPNPKKNLANKRFGKLLVLAPNGRNPGGNSIWMCQCDCGAIKDILYQHLVTGRTQSCGCTPSGWTAYHQKRRL